jgi:excisionase family DNA binding protein
MPRKPSREPEGALYVRLPASAVDKLDRASIALGVAKKDLIAGLVTKYVDPDSRRGLSALGTLSGADTPAPPGGGATGPGPTMGTYSFQSYDAPELPEVLNAEQAGQLLQVDEKVVLELAEAGKLPGRKIGPVWRFSRAALIAWLSTHEERRR